MFLESLESRRLLSAVTDMLVTQANADRMDPQAAAVRVGATVPAGVTAQPALVRSATLDGIAQTWAQWNADNHTLTHVGPDGSVPLTRADAVDSAVVYCIENAGLTGSVWSNDPNQLGYYAMKLQDDFVKSEGHFIQLCDPRTREIGIGATVGTYQGIQCLFLVEEYGTIRPTLADANNDGVVDAKDFVVVAQHFGQPVAGFGWESGDFNADGVVNALDFNALASDFGSIQ